MLREYKASNLLLVYGFLSSLCQRRAEEMILQTAMFVDARRRLGTRLLMVVLSLLIESHRLR